MVVTHSKFLVCYVASVAPGSNIASYPDFLSHIFGENPKESLEGFHM